MALTVKATLGSLGAGYNLGDVGKVSVSASPFGEVSASTDLGPAGFSKPSISTKLGFRYSATAQAGPVKLTGNVSGEGDPATGKVSLKAGASASVGKAAMGSDGPGVQLPGASISVMPHLHDLFVMATERAYEWALPGLNFITGH